jgi:hypothetical protein
MVTNGIGEKRIALSADDGMIEQVTIHTKIAHQSPFPRGWRQKTVIL